MADSKTEQPKSLASSLLLTGLIVVVAALAYLFLSPKTYRATTRLRVVDWVKYKDAETKPIDQKVVLVECDLIHSNAVQDQAINDLDLMALWGARYHPGVPMQIQEARARLNSCTTVIPGRGSSVIDISAVSEDPNEAAKIANAIAHAYLSFQQKHRGELINAKLGTLKKQWDAHNEKIRAAQADVDKIYFEVVRDRSTNETQFYDSDSYDLIKSKRTELESKLINQQRQLGELRKMAPEDLRNALSSMDPGSLLSATMLQLGKAKSELMRARLDHGEDSREVKDATVAVDKLTVSVSQQTDAAMKIREADLIGLQNTLAEMDRKIKNASTNIAPLNIQDAGYQKALANLKQLKQEREDLQKKMDAEETQDAIKPTGVVSDVFETAEPPAKPFIPDPKIAVGGIVAGILIALFGFTLTLLEQKKSLVQPKASLPK